MNLHVKTLILAVLFSACFSAPGFSMPVYFMTDFSQSSAIETSDQGQVPLLEVGARKKAAFARHERRKARRAERRDNRLEKRAERKMHRMEKRADRKERKKARLERKKDRIENRISKL